MPGKPTMMISTTIGNTALIQWQPPKEMVGEHVGYQLQYKRAEEEAFVVKEFRQTDDHFTVTGLHKGATYIFKLCAKNRAGNGEEYIKEISTPEDVPSSYPQNLRVVGLTATSTSLTWDPPPLAERNGKIVKYIVVYRDINSQHNVTNSTTETQLTIEGLLPDTTYDIRVQAFTGKGEGPISPSIQSRTMSTSMPSKSVGGNLAKNSQGQLRGPIMLHPNHTNVTAINSRIRRGQVSLHLCFWRGFSVEKNQVTA